MASTPGPIEVVQLPISGMTCASCVNRIERFVNRVDGVAEATVNLATEQARVAFDPGATSVRAITRRRGGGRLRGRGGSRGDGGDRG